MLLKTIMLAITAKQTMTARVDSNPQRTFQYSRVAQMCGGKMVLFFIQAKRFAL